MSVAPSHDHIVNVARDSIHRIASTTKPVTTSLILALITNAQLALDDEVRRWLPELASPRVLRVPNGPLDDTVPAESEITVRDLLSLTNGLGVAIQMFMNPPPGRSSWPRRSNSRSPHSDRPIRRRSPIPTPGWRGSVRPR